MLDTCIHIGPKLLFTVLVTLIVDKSFQLPMERRLSLPAPDLYPATFTISCLSKSDALSRCPALNV